MDEAKIKKIEPAFVDERGIITDLLNKPISHVGLIVTEKDALRARHYHNTSIQYNYLIEGKFEVTLSSSDAPSEERIIILEPGYLLTIPPKTIHKFKALTKTILVDMISNSREGTGYEDDVVRISN